MTTNKPNDDASDSATTALSERELRMNAAAKYLETTRPAVEAAIKKIGSSVDPIDGVLAGPVEKNR